MRSAVILFVTVLLAGCGDEPSAPPPSDEPPEPQRGGQILAVDGASAYLELVRERRPPRLDMAVSRHGKPLVLDSPPVLSLLRDGEQIVMEGKRLEEALWRFEGPALTTDIGLARVRLEFDGRLHPTLLPADL